MSPAHASERRAASPPGGIAGAAAPLRAIVRLAVAHAGRRAGEIGVVLDGDERLRELNRRWRGLDRATDVLSFDYEEVGAAGAGRRVTRASSTRPPVHGDLVISLDRARVQARRYRVSEGRELARLAIHGALHLAGLDHDTAATRAHMRRAERDIMRAAAPQVKALDRAFDRAAGRPARRVPAAPRARSRAASRAPRRPRHD
jgi:probable rRNA maturation factor